MDYKTALLALCVKRGPPKENTITCGDSLSVAAMSDADEQQ